ncbi:MAG: DUF2142 domain-containing protein [Phenylobacterium sp.]|uniref:DUF2142 domain-containing protein n=1 Tax=Phenylobacterium sp. TaxID=1871053 RepID=UPI00391B9165
MSSRIHQLHRACPYVFVVLALATSLFLALKIPPFMNADEVAHAQRANLTTFGRLIGERTGTPQARVAGGMVDIPIAEAAEPFGDMRFHPEVKATPADFEAAAQYRFDGRIMQTAFPGAAVYPPVFYLPASAAMAVGKAFDWRVVDTLYLARAAGAVCCVLLGFLALRIAGRARWPMFAILALPMSCSLYAAVSCDGLLLVTTALGVALASRAIYEQRAMTPKAALAAALCFGLVAATKPPYAVFGLILLTAPGLTLRLRALAAAISFGLPVAWSLWMDAAVRTPIRLPGTAVDAEAQAALLMAHPLNVWPIAVNTLTLEWDFLLRSAIGILGWLDTPLPKAIYPAAVAAVVLAVLVALGGRTGRAWTATKAAAPVIVALAGGGVFLGMYLLWTDVGLDKVNGVQGRYLLPLAVFATLLVEGARAARAHPATDAVKAALAGLVLAFPVASFAVVVHAVMQRFYGG